MLIVCRMRNEPPKFHYQLHFYSVKKIILKELPEKVKVHSNKDE